MLLHQLVVRHVRLHPDAPAITAEDRTLTYAELWAESGALAGALSARGIGAEDLVAVCCDRDSRLVVALLGVARGGAAAVPLDAVHPVTRLARLVSDSGARLVVHSGAAGAEVASRADVESVLVEAPGPPARYAEPAVRPANAAYVVFTSGSTGDPKGVVVEHRQAVALLHACATPIDTSTDDVWTCVHSASFDFSVWEVWGCLSSGGRLVVVPSDVAWSAPDLADLVTRQRVTVLSQTPGALRALAEGMHERGWRADDLSLRHVVLGGEAVNPGDLRRWFSELAPGGARLHNLYGITETTVHVTHRLLDPADTEVDVSPIGTALDGYSCTVGDPDPAKVRPTSEGELFVGGAGVARGYLGRPSLTADRFLPDPSVRGGRCYRTGDLVRLQSDGALAYVGRLDRQVKLRGHRIELGEVEAALRALPEVEEAHASVISRDHAADSARLVAFVRSTHVRTTGEDVTDQLRDQLPAHLVPEDVVLVDRIPLTGRGKVDMAALRARWEARRFGPADDGPDDRSPGELALADSWSHVLGVEKVGLDDRFFAVGGNSLLSIRVTGLLRQRGWRLEVGDLLRLQRLGDVAATLRRVRLPDAEHDDDTAPVLGSLLSHGIADSLRSRPGVVDAYPLTSLQTGMVAESSKASGAGPYHVVSSVDLTSVDGLDAGAWRQLWRSLMARHEVLRTTFDLFALGEPVQVVHRAPESPVLVRDLVDQPTSAHDDLVAAALHDLDAAPFEVDRSDQLLWRVLGLRRAGTRWTLLFAHHHALLDGWSLATLLREVRDRVSAPGPIKDRPPTPPFGDYVRAEMEATECDATASYWRTTVEGAELPRLAWVAGGQGGDESPSAECSLAEVRPAALALAVDLEVPVKSVFLAAAVMALRDLEGRTVVTGLVTNGRLERPGAAEALGLFLNTQPLVVRLRGGSWRDLVREVWSQERTAYPHRHYPAAAISRATGLRSAPVAFTYNDFTGAGFPSFRAQVRETGYSSVPLTVVVVGDSCLVEGSPAHVSAGDCRRLAERIRDMLLLMTADPAETLPAPAVGVRVEGTDEAERSGGQAPATDLETTMAEAWSRLLGEPVADRQANFFELGGDSILAIKLMSRLSADLGVPLGLAPVFESADLAEMALEVQALLDSAGRGPAS